MTITPDCSGSALQNSNILFLVKAVIEEENKTISFMYLRGREFRDKKVKLAL